MATGGTRRPGDGMRRSDVTALSARQAPRSPALQGSRARKRERDQSRTQLGGAASQTLQLFDN